MGGFDIHPYLPYLLGVVTVAVVGGLVKLAAIALVLRKTESKDLPDALRSLAPLFGRKIELRILDACHRKPDDDD